MLFPIQSTAKETGDQAPGRLKQLDDKKLIQRRISV